MKSGMCYKCKKHYSVHPGYNALKHFATCPDCNSHLTINPLPLDAMIKAIRLSKNEIGVSVSGIISQ